MLLTRKTWKILAAMTLPAVAWALLSLVGALEAPFLSMFEGPPPPRTEIVAMLAAHEDVPPSDINLHIVDTKTELPHLLYSIENVPDPAPVDRLPIVQRVLVHPSWDPWSWGVGGGTRSDGRDPGEAATFGFTSASGDLKYGEAATVIYGVTAPNAAEVHVTVQGETHVRDVRETGGYLILLPNQGLNPSVVTEFRIFTGNGDELSSPI